MSRPVKFKFHGRKEVLDIVNTGGELVEYLSSRKAECPLIGSEIKLVKELGKGAAGTVFLVKIKGMGEKDYVAKAMDSSITSIIISIKEPTPLKYVIERISYDEFPFQTIVDVNGGDPEKLIYPGETIFYPTYAINCKMGNKISVKKFDRGLDRPKPSSDKMVFPKGSYLCEDAQYSEYVIGILCGEIYRKGISINFHDVFSFATCASEDPLSMKKFKAKPQNIKVRQYIFMEKVDNSLRNISKCAFDGDKKYIASKKISEYFKNSGETQKETTGHANFFDIIQNIDKIEEEPVFAEVLLVQVLHAIRCYQKMHKIQHNDLHDGNIFIEYVKPDTIFNGQNLYDADWFHYRVDETDLYLPWIPMIAKIGDFGLSVKYSEPIVGNMKSALYGYGDEDEDDDESNLWVPNYYAKSSDAVYTTYAFWLRNTRNKFIANIFRHMINLRYEYTHFRIVRDQTVERVSEYFKAGNGSRPLPTLTNTKMYYSSPKHILTNSKLMEKYLKKPKTGNIVTLGTI